jgi:hypothetical protein
LAKNADNQTYQTLTEIKRQFKRQRQNTFFPDKMLCLVTELTIHEKNMCDSHPLASTKIEGKLGKSIFYKRQRSLVG